MALALLSEEVYSNCWTFVRDATQLGQIPGNGHDAPRSKVAPRPASRVPRNGSDAPRNARIVPGSIFTPRKDPTVPRNAETVPGNIHRPPGPT